MRASRILAAVVLACVLAACQSAAGTQAGAKPASSSAAASGSWLDPKEYENYEVTAPMKQRTTEITVRLVTKLVTRCIDAKGEAQMNACFRERLLAGFDTKGIAASHCPARGTIEEQYLCIVLGSYSYEFVRTVGGEEDPQIDWTDPERTMKLAVAEFVMQQAGTCLGGSSASDPTDCIVGAITKRLGLASSDIEPCRSLAEDTKFGQCIGEAFGLRYMDAGIARM